MPTQRRPRVRRVGKIGTLRTEEVTPYDLFIVAVTLLSLVNILLHLFLKDIRLEYTIAFIDAIISLIFLFDFLRRFRRASSKGNYFFKEYGWADLIASFPFPQFKILRIFRLVKAYGIIKRAGIQKIGEQLNRYRATSALLTVFFTIMLLLEFGSVGILLLEADAPGANITTASDALWWVYVTITTVGYGDAYPVTNGGRLLGMFVMLVGVGLFGVITAYLANKFLPPQVTPTELPKAPSKK